MVTKDVACPGKARKRMIGFFMEQGGYIQAEANGGGEKAYQDRAGRQQLQVVGGLSMQEIKPDGITDLPITEVRKAVVSHIFEDSIIAGQDVFWLGHGEWISSLVVIADHGCTEW